MKNCSDRRDFLSLVGRLVLGGGLLGGSAWLIRRDMQNELPVDCGLVGCEGCRHLPTCTLPPAHRRKTQLETYHEKQ